MVELVLGGTISYTKLFFLKNGLRTFECQDGRFWTSGKFCVLILKAKACGCDPVNVVKKVACTLHYLSDEGPLRKTAKAFGLSRQVVSKIMWEVYRAIAIHLGLDYIKLPFTEKKKGKRKELFLSV